jgi:hypothetical protein
MPTITNFGDVVTVGNAAVNGTGTSSFAGPVTFAQGVSITGAVSTSSAFYGVLAGANTLAASAITASTNVYAPIVTTPLVNAATVQATTGFYGVLAGANIASVTVLNATQAITPLANIASLNVSSQANVTFLNVSSTAFLSNANVATANITSSNVLTENVSTLNVSGFTTLFRANVLTANITSANVTTGNVSVLNVASAWFTVANLATGNLTTANVTTGNVSVLNVASAWFTVANLATGNLTTANITTGNVSVLNVASAWFTNANLATGNITTANISSLNVTGDANVANVTVRSNLYASNIIMSSNLSTNTGFGNVYLTGNLVVAGNIFSIGGSVGSGSGTSQGVLYSLGGAGYPLGAPFITGSAGPGIAGYHINLSPAYFNPEAVASVSAFSAGSGMLKFATGGLYQVTCVIVGDQPVVKVAFGKTSSSSFAALPATATSGYDYVYNFPVNSSPSTVITIPLTVQDVTQYYYLDVFFSTAAGTPSTLYPTRSTTAVGSAYGTYVQVGPFGNYLTSATGVASGLLMNAYGTTTLSSPVTSNTFRLAMTSSNGWTVNGVSASLAVTSGGNFQVSQVGIYEVSMCLNTSVTPLMFGVGSLATDTAPGTQGPYIYQYAPMYTQDPTTVVTLPLNITDTSKYYYVDVIFPGTQSTVALSNVSTFVSLKPVGSYVSPSTNPWTQQGTSVYYQDGPVAIGGVNPSALTETFTVNGNTAFVGNVTVTSDASGNAYVLADRIPAGSLDVTQYVTGSVPLTTTTNLIQKYLSNAATITANTSTGTITQALRLPGTTNSGVNFQSGGSSVALIPTNTTNVFIEAWINPGVTTTGVIVAVGTGSQLWNLYLSGASFLTFNASGGGTQTASSLALSAGTWYHVAVSLTPGLATKANIWVNGTQTSYSSTATGLPAALASANVYIGQNFAGGNFTGNVADVRIWSGGIIPTTATRPSGFTATAAPFGTSQPAYITGTPTLQMSLQSQYFPGASTSPYGPVLTLPGTVGSYYSAVNTAFNSSWGTTGITFEAWVNYASLANCPIVASGGSGLGHLQPTGGNSDWVMGATTSGQFQLYYNGGGVSSWVYTSGICVITGQWTHIVFQSNGSRIFLFVNGAQRTDLVTSYTNTGTASAASINGTPLINANTPISLGQYNSTAGPNFAIAKARLVFGTTGTNGNVYSSGNFTANPNFATVPAGATVAWSLDSQYPLPTYPSFFDVPVLPQQIQAYGAEPVVVGGVTSNVLSPYSTTYPQLDSVRFDGTGYIDYGNAASSVLCSNLWASPWTIEAWVYPTVLSGNIPIFSRSSYGTTTTFDLLIYTQGTSLYAYAGGFTSASSALSLNTWQHIAVTYDGTQSNIYVGGTWRNGGTLTPYTYTPTHGTLVGAWGPGVALAFGATTSFQGNLADLRVSNVARYTGSSYTVPPEPHPTNNANTLLLLRSLGGQVGTTLEVQGRGTQSVSLGATQTVRAYPPAPMSSYLLDTTSNASVTYGQGKYVASASGVSGGTDAWMAFDKLTGTVGTTFWQSGGSYSASSPYNYTGSVTTVDSLGNSYAGEWLQIQLPVSVLLSSYSIASQYNTPILNPTLWVILGSRDGINWTLVNSQSYSGWVAGIYTTFNVSASQAYNFYRIVIQRDNSYTVAGVGDWTLNGTEESLCISNDAKVGVGIANPQRALEVAGDLVVGGTISGGAGMGQFRNRIINGDMRIAQRGTSNTSTTTGATVFVADRFSMNTPTGPSSVSFTNIQNTLAASDAPYQIGFRYSWRSTTNIGIDPDTFNSGFPRIQHSIEGYNISDFNWGTSFGTPVTFSFWFRSNSPSGSIFNIRISNSGASYNYITTFVYSGAWQYVVTTIPPPPNGSSWDATNGQGIFLCVGELGGGAAFTTPAPNSWTSTAAARTVSGTTRWPQTAGNYIEVTGVQLEKGTVATPFEVRPYAQELALCQRYYTQLNAGSTFARFGTAYSVSTTSSNVYVPLPVTLRAQPTLTMTVANFRVDEGSSQQTVTSVTPASGSAITDWQLNAVGLTVGHGAVAAANLPGFLEANGTTSAVLGFSAEL